MKTEEQLKGKFKGNCNRTACQAPGAVWFNYSTKAFYCGSCAHQINFLNRKDAMRLFGHDLCVKMLVEDN